LKSDPTEGAKRWVPAAAGVAPKEVSEERRRIMSQKDRRVSARVPARFKVNYVHDGDYLISYTKDLSVDGMFIYTEKPPEAGEEVKLIFSLDDLPIVTVWARVIWTNEKNSEGDKDAGMGVRFIGLPADARTAIFRIVNRILVGDKKILSLKN
jgi:uncharacterized protein (TIGR02266 family)